MTRSVVVGLASLGACGGAAVDDEGGGTEAPTTTTDPSTSVSASTSATSAMTSTTADPTTTSATTTTTTTATASTSSDPDTTDTATTDTGGEACVDDHRVVAFLANWAACPTAEQLAQYSEVVIAFAVTYQWTPDGVDLRRELHDLAGRRLHRCGAGSARP